METTPITTPFLLLFTLDERQFALRLEAVQRTIRAAAITALPKAPDIVLGILAIQGEFIPVINVRKRFRLPERAIRPEDQFIIARARSLTVALVVDAVDSVMAVKQQRVVPADDILSGMAYVAGVTRTAEGVVLIHDLDTFLSLDEESLLAEALEQTHG